MRYLIALLALATSACTSFGALQSSPVDSVVRSSKSVDQFAACVSREVGKATIPAEDGAPMIAVTNTYGSPLATFTFYPDGSGSRADVRKHSGLAAVEFVEDCA